jgi:uncharacterized membrane protein YkoI
MDGSKVVAAVLIGTMAAGTLGAAGAAYAIKERTSATNEGVIIANAKITMAQAIATAESQLGGKAVGSGIEDHNGTMAFAVEVLKDGKRHKVLIDLQSGQVVKNAMAKGERNENGGDNH